MPGSAHDVPFEGGSATTERTSSLRLIPAPRTRRTSCVVADDHPVVLHAVCTYLEARGIKIVARALDGRDALERIAAQQPEVALIDLGLPNLKGAEAAGAIRKVAPSTAVVFYAGHADLAHAAAALDAGARGFVLKEAPLWELARAIEVVGAGGCYVDPAFAGALMESGVARLLTAAEHDLLRLVAEGLSDKAIGVRLVLSRHTVEQRLATVMAKLGVSTRTEAVALALRQQIID
jgi:DNA-binding NarL/FixJ family response regulator